MPRILLIEDDAALLRMYTKWLQSTGAIVIGVSTLQAVQTMPNMNKFDLCISDIQVGIIKGEVMLHQIDQLRYKHGLPVLVISSEIERYKGVCALLSLPTLAKPFNVDQLLENTFQLIPVNASV